MGAGSRRARKGDVLCSGVNRAARGRAGLDAIPEGTRLVLRRTAPYAFPETQSGHRINPFSFGALRGELFPRLLLFQMGGKKKFLIRLRGRAAASLPAAAPSQPQLCSCSCAPANF